MAQEELLVDEEDDTFFDTSRCCRYKALEW